MLITAQVLKEKWLKIMVFAHSQTTNKLVNEAVHDSVRVSGQDRKIPPPLDDFCVVSLVSLLASFFVSKVIHVVCLMKSL